MKLSKESAVFLYAILLSDFIFCDGASNEITIEFPESVAVKTLEVKIIKNDKIPSLTINCLNYDALRDLNQSILGQINWTSQQGKWILFSNCFNNDTTHINYKNFKLNEFLDTGPNGLWESIDVRFHEFGFVDSNVFFNNFKFNQYNLVHLYNVGFETTTFLSNIINNTEIKFGKNNLMDFNQFAINRIPNVHSFGNNILNFNADNLKKFVKLKKLQLYYNNFNDDVNVFNVPNLFEFNPTLNTLSLENSVSKIVLHENVFEGLHDLEQVSLANNQIEHIPENLFRDLTSLKKIVLDNNAIKHLKINTFLNNIKLLYLSLDGNKLLSTESINNLKFATTTRLEISLQEIEFSSITQVENILRNPNIYRLDLSQFFTPHLSIEDFNMIENRTDQIKVTLSAGSTLYNIPIITAKNFIKPITEYGTLLEIDVRDEARMCHDCNFIKQVFTQDDDYVYAKYDHLNLLFQFTLSEQCRTRSMLENFYHKFDQNCPEPCECQHNEFIDNVRINCSDKNLTSIPILPYPTQFSNGVDSIDLIFKNNLLRVIDFLNQNAMVMEKLSTLDFENNTIESINMDVNPPKQIYHFNVCGNPFLKFLTGSLNITTSDGVEKIQEENCLVETSFIPDLKSIVLRKSAGRVKELLETCS